jgi:hypothetical protein
MGEAARLFAEPLGGIGVWGEPMAFDKTAYYEPEMGAGLSRRFLCTCSLASATRLGELKATAWDIEQRFAVDGRRRVNLDPGYLDHGKVVLASFKPGPQKLFIGQGVWADIVLFFAHGAYGALPWSFPDLRSQQHEAFFMAARQHYRKTLKLRMSQTST